MNLLLIPLILLLINTSAIYSSTTIIPLPGSDENEETTTIESSNLHYIDIPEDSESGQVEALEEDVTELKSSATRKKECTCGISRPSVDYIIGGTQANEREFPWLVAITQKRSTYMDRLFCGGTLINSRYVLTAAHCLTSKVPSFTHLWFNTHKLSSLGKEKGAQRSFNVSAKRFIIHKGWNRKTFRNDIALIELESEIDLFDNDKNISTACLPSASDDYAGKSAIVAGWGYWSLTAGKTANTLRKVTVPILSNKACSTKGLVGEKLWEGMICAGYKEGKRDACINDSGGPLMVKNKSGKDQIVGIVSFGQGCAEPDLPGAYTRVSKYLDWIAKNSEGGMKCKA